MKKIDNFFLKMCALNDNSLWNVFTMYAIVLLVLQLFAYTIEKLAGLSTEVRWYDLVMIIFLVLVFLANVRVLLKVMIHENGLYTMKDKEGEE